MGVKHQELNDRSSDSGPPEGYPRDEHKCPVCECSWLSDDDSEPCPECGKEE